MVSAPILRKSLRDSFCSIATDSTSNLPLAGSWSRKGVAKLAGLHNSDDRVGGWQPPYRDHVVSIRARKSIWRTRPPDYCENITHINRHSPKEQVSLDKTLTTQPATDTDKNLPDHLCFFNLVPGFALSGMGPTLALDGGNFRNPFHGIVRGCALRIGFRSVCKL